MDADLDLLLTVVYCSVDDLLPAKPANARRRVTDAEVITLCVAQAMLGCRSDAQFIAVASRRLRHLFPDLPDRSGFHKRRLRLSDVMERLIAHFAHGCQGFYDDLLLVDSTPVECARSRETVKRGGHSSLENALSNAADYGHCASHSRFFWGFRLHALFALDGTPRALTLTSPKVDEKEVCLRMVARCERQHGRMLSLIGDKNFRGKQFERDLANLDATIHRPHRKDENGRGPHLAPIRQRIESIFWTAKDILGLERHRSRTLDNLRARLVASFTALTAAIKLNHELDRPSRSLACYTA
ncbi:MAG: IS982 family transposase [Gaiellales bacterium]